MYEWDCVDSSLSLASGLGFVLGLIDVMVPRKLGRKLVHFVSLGWDFSDCYSGPAISYLVPEYTWSDPSFLLVKNVNVIEIVTVQWIGRE